MSDTEPEQKTITAAFPYLMVLFAFFLQGFVFLTINGPLLLDLSKRTVHPDFRALAAAQLQKYAAILLQPRSPASEVSADASVTAAFVVFYLLMSLIVGFGVQWVAGSLGAVSRGCCSWLVRWLPEVKGLPAADPVLFSARGFLDSDYASLKIWLLEHKAFKLEWEWELFNYYVYWGFLTNLTLFGGMAFMSVQTIGPSSAFSFLAVWLFALFQSLMRSRTMQIVHVRCLRQMGQAPPN